MGLSQVLNERDIFGNERDHDADATRRTVTTALIIMLKGRAGGSIYGCFSGIYRFCAFLGDGLNISSVYSRCECQSEY